MRSPDNAISASLGRGLVTVFLAAGLAACGMAGGGSHSSGLASAGNVQAVNGPAADYPVTVGEPYSVDGVEYTPSETLNVDQVGYVTLEESATGYSGAHHTLPLPSYAEVTSLETGRTILVRLERRGPMASNHVLALSPAALAQLEAGAEHPVRIRRVNPPENHRAMLRGGNAAPLRMDTPASLLTVLQRRLPAIGAASLHASAAAEPQRDDIETVEIAASSVVQDSLVAVTVPEPLPAEGATVEPAPAPGTPVDPVPAASVSALPPVDAGTEEIDFAAAFGDDPTLSEPTAPQAEPEGQFVVQAAAFANADNARRAADALNGQISQSGRFYRVRTGPFATRGEAEASLANVQSAGYSDARILTGG